MGNQLKKEGDTTEIDNASIHMELFKNEAEMIRQFLLAYLNHKESIKLLSICDFVRGIVMAEGEFKFRQSNLLRQFKKQKVCPLLYMSIARFTVK